MTSTQSRQPSGIPTGGQFTESFHAEPTVSLPSAENDPLTAKDITWAKELTGTHYADSASDYYPTMDRIFAAAREQVESTPEGRREAALQESALKLAPSLGVKPHEVREFYARMAESGNVGEPEYQEALSYYSDLFGASEFTLKMDLREMRNADPGPRHLDPFYDKLARIENTPLDELTPEDLQYLINAEGSHQLSPVVGWALRHREDEEAHKKALGSWKERLDNVGTEVGRKLFKEQPVDEWGLPRIKGFTADEVEEQLARDCHQDQCGCDLSENVCGTFGTEWRGRCYVTNVHAVFKAMTEMAAARAKDEDVRYRSL